MAQPKSLDGRARSCDASHHGQLHRFRPGLMRIKKPPGWIQPGAIVDYRAVYDGPVTAHGLVIAHGPEVIGQRWVVWLQGMDLCVAIDQIERIQSKRKKGIENEEPGDCDSDAEGPSTE